MIQPEKIAEAFDTLEICWERTDTVEQGRYCTLSGVSHRGARYTVYVTEKPSPMFYVTMNGNVSGNPYDTFEVCVAAAEDWIMRNIYGPMIEDSALRLGARISYNPHED